MGESPTVETRIDQPYAAIPVSVTMEELGTVVPPLTGQVVGWLAGRGICEIATSAPGYTSVLPKNPVAHRWWRL